MRVKNHRDDRSQFSIRFPPNKEERFDTEDEFDVLNDDVDEVLEEKLSDNSE